ncbi:MAG: protein kinase [Planctomycetota bacterium]
MNDEPDRERCLQQAAVLFAARCADPSPEPIEQFLLRHERLREWLEPMLSGAADVEGPTEVASTERLGAFRLLREIGRGGMGIVHEARRDGATTPVALKVLPGFHALLGDRVARFRREAAISKRLDHPGIVHVLDSGSAGDAWYLAMEFVVGAPLDRVLHALQGHRPKDLTTADLATAARDHAHVPSGDVTPFATGVVFAGSYVAAVARIALQIAEALSYAHRAGVIHRDVKPSNLLLRLDGSVVLTDLGLARETDGPALTMTGDFAGTPHYVSPEQAMARRVPVDHRSDLFSLGSTLYELLTLHHAFAGDTAQEVLGRILTKEPPAMTRLHPGLPEDLVNIVGRLLEKDPDRRYPDAAALAADLTAFLDYRSVAARRVSQVRRLRRWARREPAKAALAAVLALGVPALAAAGGYIYASIDDIRAGREQRRTEAVAGDVDRGFLAFMQEDPASAHREFEAALALDASDGNAQVGIVLTLLHWEGPEPALRRVEGDLAAHLAPGLAGLLRYSLLKLMDRDAEAKQVLAAAPDPHSDLELFAAAFLSCDSGFNTGADVLDYIERAVLASDRPRLWLHVAWANFADAAGDVGACRRSAATLLENWPDSPEARYFAAMAESHVDADRAQLLCEELRAQRPDLGIAHAMLGQILRRRGDLPGALSAFTRATELAPKIPSIRYSLGKARYDSGDAAGAEREFRAACELSPRFTMAWMGLGMALRAESRLGDAREALRQAVEQQPNSADPHFQYGQVLQMLGELQPAIAEFKKATRYQHADPNKWHHLAGALIATGDDKGAREALQRAVKEAPRSERAHALLVMYHQNAGNQAAAREALSAWVEALPGSIQGWAQYGQLALSDSPDAPADPVTAAWAARRVLQLTRDGHAEAWLLLARAEELLGHREATRQALQRSLSATNPRLEQEARDDCERRLRALDGNTATPPAERR